MLIAAKAGVNGPTYGIFGLRIRIRHIFIGEVKMYRSEAIPIFLFLILYLIIPISEAKDKPGSDVLIQKTNGTEVRGELIAVKSISILILDAKTGADVTTEVKGIYSIKVIKKSHPWKGAGYGMLAGAVTGLLYWAMGGEVDEPGKFYTQKIPLYFSPRGALAGLILSQLVAIDKTYLIQGRSPEAIEAILDKLRKKARVKDFN